MRFYELPPSLEQEIQHYEELIDGYLRGSINKVEMKAIRVPMGVYEQRDQELYMLRIRLPGGAITPKQLVELAAIAAKYTEASLHFTTRQDVQVHGLKLKDTARIMRELKEIGLSSRGGGGNTIRNIICAYDSGVDPEEAFYVFPYAKALTSRMIAEADSWNLPRKFKIAFSGSKRDKGLATVNDLGFIAKINEDGERGFAVYIAGGMGAKPRLGFRLYEFVPENEVYNIVKAAKIFFDKYGNRKNKHAARLRFLYEKLGKEEFVRRFQNELAEVRKSNYPPLEVEAEPPLRKGFLEIPLFLGDLTFDKAQTLGLMLKDYGEDVLRVTPTQNLFLRNIPEDAVPRLRAELRKAGITEPLPPLLEKATACAGAGTCKLGICLSRGLLAAIKEELTREPVVSSKISDLSLKISGCPNSCGQHLIADIGFFGAAKRHDNHLVPYYHLLVGGVVGEGETSFGQNIAAFPAKAVPSFLREFLDFVAQERAENEDFNGFLDRAGRAEILRLEKKYSKIPAFDVDRDYYYDWSSREVFSLAEKVEGECSAGLFDLIEWDLRQAEEGLKRLKTGENTAAEFAAVVRGVTVSVCRALLITKGLEPKTETEAVELFKTHFIGRHLDSTYAGVLDKYLAGSPLGAEEVEALFHAVENLYHSMDDSLRFPDLRPVQRPGEDAPARLGPSFQKVFRDFRGVACPMNFVKTKLVLETMNLGEILEIWLDDGDPIANVPGSLRAEGYKILEQKKLGDYWSVTIQKGN